MSCYQKCVYKFYPERLPSQAQSSSVKKINRYIAIARSAVNQTSTNDLTLLIQFDCHAKGGSFFKSIIVSFQDFLNK